MQLSFNPFGEGTGEILLNIGECYGTEASLIDCEGARWRANTQTCGHDEDVAVTCVDDNLAITGNLKWAFDKIRIPAMDLMLIC